MLSLVIKLRKWIHITKFIFQSSCFMIQDLWFKIQDSSFKIYDSIFKNSYSFHIFNIHIFFRKTFLKTCSSKSIFSIQKLNQFKIERLFNWFILIHFNMFNISHFLFHFWYLFCYVRVLRNHEIGRWLSTS